MPLEFVSASVCLIKASQTRKPQPKCAFIAQIANNFTLNSLVLCFSENYVIWEGGN